MALAHAILAVLLESPCSGYDLMKRFEGSVGFFWRASHQQIYRELGRMEKQGWLQAELIQQEGRPNKKRYSVTEIGRDQLKEWILTPVEVSPVRDDMLVKLYVGYLVSPEQILEQLQHHQQQHHERLQVYRQIESCSFPDASAVLSATALYQYQTLRYGILYETQWLAWCEEVIHTLRLTHQISPQEAPDP